MLHWWRVNGSIGRERFPLHPPIKAEHEAGPVPFFNVFRIISLRQYKRARFSQVTVGCQVCLRHFPIYHAGAIAVNLSGGTPKVGELLESVWSLDKKSSFKLLDDRPEPVSTGPGGCACGTEPVLVT